jgi:methane/ammonia monooxygenase subunit B
MSFRKLTRLALVALGLVIAITGVIPSNALAHGERAQEPYLRTRTLHWFDVTWSKTNIAVNEDMVIEGKFRIMEDWPDAIAEPKVAFLSVTSPGPALTRIESYINDMPARQSFRDLVKGRDYSFKVVLKGRVPGKHHIHPMISVLTVGTLVGPGQWIEVTGKMADFVYPVKTLDGRTIENLEHFNVANVMGWHLAWTGVAALWLLWWLVRPLLLPRWIALQKGREDLLILRSDVIMGGVLATVVLGMAFGGYIYTSLKYPYIIPLQSGRVFTEPLAKAEQPVAIKFINATYDVPGRSMRIKFLATNVSKEPQTLGEFTTANLRFIDTKVPAAVANVHPAFPRDMVPKGGLKVSNQSPLAPGETREVQIDATDVAWELERLTSFLTNVDSKTGGMLVYFDSKGKRSVSEIAGAILPVFKDI